MREIKFRAWMSNDEFPDGHMYYAGDKVMDRGMMMNLFGDLFTAIPSKVAEQCTFARARWMNNEITLMQYTNKIDAHTKMIYEDDLIRNSSGRICRVVWNFYTGSWDAKPINCVGNPKGFNCADWSSCVMVIGNVHESPELLQK